MKMDNYIKAIPELPKTLGASAADAHRAAVAITTTDLVSKEAALQVKALKLHTCNSTITALQQHNCSCLCLSQAWG
jgi:N-acetylglutamate synthase/N-acetylornithine aminotransferase